MAREERAVYDPDATELQMQAVSAIGAEDLEPEDKRSQGFIWLLSQNYKVVLTQLKLAQQEILGLRDSNGTLRQNIEDLRVDLAGLRERRHATWLEIPAAIIAGFSVTMLTANSRSVEGWLMLAMTVVILFYLRVAPLLQYFIGGRASQGKRETRD